MSDAKIIEVNLSECYLRNIRLENNPTNQKSSQFYQKVFESIKNKGIINPLTVVKKKIDMRYA
jgi:ParB-like chromosome segregation protein Spo0J